MALSDILGNLERVLQPFNFRDGPEHLADHSAPPRIVAVPTEDGFGPSGATWIGEPEPLHDCESSVDFHVWGRTRAATEELRNVLIGAIRDLVPSSYSLAGGRWEQQDATAIQALGRLYVLRVTFTIPVTRSTRYGEATITSVTTDTATTGTP